MKTYVVGQVPSGYAPLPPENVLINGARYPADISGQYTISWAPNPREHMYGPAVSGDETYTLRLYDETDTLRRTVTGITGNSYTWSTEATDSGLGNLNWSDITALLHFDGANGSTTITDEKGSTWTAIDGGVISTAQSRFGGASLGAGTATRSAGISMTGDFTVEAWVYLNGTGQIVLLTNGSTESGRAKFFIDNRLLYLDRYGAGVYQLGSVQVPLNTWAHIAFVRSAGVVTGYINGVAGNTPYTNSSTYGNGGGLFSYISQGLSGYYMDELLIEAARARYTANFTPPAAPYAPPRYNSSIRTELETVRDGVTSYQKQVIKTLRSVTTV